MRLRKDAHGRENRRGTSSATTHTATGDELSGRCALALTYGAPDVNSALLVQAGLPSRAMAVKLSELYPSPNSNVRAFPRWLDSVIDDFSERRTWRDPASQEMWNDFIEEWRQPQVTKWISEERKVRFETTDADRPKVGAPVRLLYDDASKRTTVCDLFFSAHRIGEGAARSRHWKV